MKEINIAKTIISKRKDKGVTQDELAAYIGVSKASVSKWETGLSYPDITFLPQLAAYFNISIDELIGYEPQMTKEDILKLYSHLTHEFSCKPFNQVMGECHQIIKKYYSCFPLLMKMAILFTNHYMLAAEKEQQEAVLEEAVELCRRIKAEGSDMFLLSEANSIEAICTLVLNCPEEVIELLDGILKPKPSDEALLASAYHMKGNFQKSREVLQIGIYQHLMSMLGLLPSYLLLFVNSPEMFEIVLHRTFTVAEIFEINKLHPSIMLQTYLAAAQGYVMKNNVDKALDMLEKYTEICIKEASTLSLHGDKFFDSIEQWFADLDLGNQLPRDVKVIKKSMVQVITDSPVFAVLNEQPRFNSIIEKIKVLI